jgi:hypothetical protein
MEFLNLDQLLIEAGMPIPTSKIMSTYNGKSFKCACGEIHKFNNKMVYKNFATNGANAKMLLKCPTNMNISTLIKTKYKYVFVFDYFESLAGTNQNKDDKYLEENIPTVKMTKEEINDIEINGLKLLEGIEEEVKMQKIGYTTEFKTFKGNYNYYRKFFQQLKDFKDNDRNSYMFTINSAEMIIGVTIVNLEPSNLMNISAEKLY